MTTNDYIEFRKNKIDPFTYEKLNDTIAFKYHAKWNPYTGIVTGVDENGPIYFSPITLMMHYYHNRLKNLWFDTYYDPYTGDTFRERYGDHVGIGDDFEIIGRRKYPESYLFRIPLIDCYADNSTFVTMGPKLSNREICEIDRLIAKHWTKHEYFTTYKKIKSLYNLKRYYDLAISKNPKACDLMGLDVGTIDDLKKFNGNTLDLYLNRIAVERLKQMM
jgi:hypothetical protein